MTEVLVCVVVVVVADPLWLTKSAFGELISHVGTDPQPYAFAGEPLDPNSGFQYHRARWMDPRVGRFVGMDPFEGRAFDPPSLHRYLCVADDPANKVDPSGRDFNLGTVLTVLGVISVLATVALDYAEGGPKAAIEGLVVGAALGVVGGGVAAGAVKLFHALIKARKVATVFRAFTRSNFRENLARLTGIRPLTHQAHHAFPVEFIDDFARAGIDIHDPIHGAWWEAGQHLANSSRYADEWREFFRVARSPDEIFEFGRKLAEKYGFEVFF
jgi:RHS repeat-associated protein